MSENLFLKNNSFVTFIHFAEILSLLEWENGWVRENDLPKTCCYLILILIRGLSADEQ